MLPSASLTEKGGGAQGEAAGLRGGLPQWLAFGGGSHDVWEVKSEVG